MAPSPWRPSTLKVEVEWRTTEWVRVSLVHVSLWWFQRRQRRRQAPKFPSGDQPIITTGYANSSDIGGVAAPRQVGIAASGEFSATAHTFLGTELLREAPHSARGEARSDAASLWWGLPRAGYIHLPAVALFVADGKVNFCCTPIVDHGSPGA